MPDALQQLIAWLRDGDPGRLGAAVARAVEGTYGEASTWTETHLAQLGLVISGIALSLYSGRFALAIRRATHTWPFPLRLAVFVLLVGVGTGAVASALAPLVTAGLALVGTPYVIPTVLGAFMVVGILAERQDRI